MVKLGVVAWYEINKQYVATVLCENKAKPKLKCNGKCYLKKQLAKADEKQDKKSESQPQSENKIEIIPFLVVEKISLPVLYCIDTIVQNDYYIDMRGIIYTSFIFHPPAIVS
ncbi:hypothetical protein CAP35_04055 [Chitinophagaceae bacterium IBVUCB1]|nr:hypothetical protein CAP35_04055 [Chitinophagaceae bacterium IBVUCB1]